MDDGLLEVLLNEPEGTAIDFKRDQYPFVGATDEQKAELLKDILSFANAWRHTDAFIIIGVREIRGGRGEVVGVSGHQDDAQLQQFVNSKTQRPAAFSYAAYPFEGKQLGIIHIPRQERPLSLVKDYASLRRNIVYIRRGSSTAEAGPDEVARMVAADRATHAEPALELELATLHDRKRIGLTARLESKLLGVPSPKSIPDYGSSIRMVTTMENNDYYREMASFLRETALLKPLSFVIANSSGIAAQDVQVQIHLPLVDGLKVLAESEYPEHPTTFLYPSGVLGSVLRGDPAIDVRRQPGEWLIRGTIGKVQPKEVRWCSESFYVGASTTQSVSGEALVFADNLAAPLRYSIKLDIETSIETLGLADLLRRSGEE